MIRDKKGEKKKKFRERVNVRSSEKKLIERNPLEVSSGS